MISRIVPGKKQLMARLLAGSLFDPFELVSGSVRTFAEFKVDGLYHAAFYPAEEREDREYVLWRSVRDYFFSCIRGKNTPLSFRFVFRLPMTASARLLDSISAPVSAEDLYGFYLNLAFDGEVLSLTTGTSFKSFTLDKTAERAFDAYILKFFSDQEIELTSQEAS